MALDPRIPLMGQPPVIDSTEQTARNVMSMRGLMDDAALRQAYVWSNGKLDRAATLQNLARVNPGMALQLQQQLGLQDKWNESADLRREDQRLRLEATRAKLIGNALGKIKGNLGEAWGAFEFQGPEAAKQSFRRSMTPIWQAIGYTPEQMDQSVEQLSPENIERFMSGSEEGTLLKMAETAVDRRGGQLFWDDGTPAYEQNYSPEGDLIRTGPVVGPDTNGAPEWAKRPPKTPEDWRKWDTFITMLHSAKIIKGTERDLFTPWGVLRNPYFARAEAEKREREREDYKWKQEVKKPDTVFMPSDRAALTRSAENEAQERIQLADAGLGRLRNIGETFQPEFLTLPYKAGMKWLDFIEWAGVNLSEENQRRLGEFSAFQLDAYDNINRYIKEITGAQMSVKEFDRLSRAIPDPDNDGPTRFKAKYDRSVVVLQRAGDLFRKQLREGLSIEDAERAAKREIMRGLLVPESGGKAAQKDPGAPPAAAEPAAPKPDGSRQIINGVEYIKRDGQWRPLR